jgi:hypothetical protein
MRGSLAIWYERRHKNDAPVEAPILELHVNLWRDLASSVNFFDVGLLLSKVSDLGRVFLFIPGPIGLAQISDLSHLLLQGNTLNAVFNDVIEVQDREEENFTTVKDESPFLRIHHLDTDSDLSTEPVEISSDLLGTILNFRKRLCGRLSQHGNERHYIRFRITLDQRTKELFSSEIDPQDWWLLSSFTRTELTEFRLNELRSLPRQVAARAEKSPFSIERLHYFLVRDFHHELVMQHADFRKVRRLEADLWRHYLRGRLPGDESGPDVLPSDAGDRMVIYHWREDAKFDEQGYISAPIEDFVAFASFRSSTSNIILFYAVAIALVGGLGAALAAWIADGLAWAIASVRLRWINWSDPENAARQVDFVANVTTFLLLVVLIVGVALILRWARSRAARRGRRGPS